MQNWDTCHEENKKRGAALDHVSRDNLFEKGVFLPWSYRTGRSQACEEQCETHSKQRRQRAEVLGQESTGHERQIICHRANDTDEVGEMIIVIK